MKNFTVKPFDFQQKSTENDNLKNQNQRSFELLGQTKISRLPSLSDRKPVTAGFSFPSLSDKKCECGSKIDRNDSFLMGVGYCRKCVILSARVEQALESYAKAKRDEWLQRSCRGGVE